MDSKIIEVKNLKRTYQIKNKGKKYYKRAVNNVSFNVVEGEVFGLLGPNGAGKSTIIKILSTLLSPSSGNVNILDKDVTTRSEEIRSQINFVFGGERGVYSELTPVQYLSYFCILYKISSKEHKELINELLISVDLFKERENKINGFSKGMIQRLHIARALINKPKIIFLDEPTIGLDPMGAKMLRDLIKKLSNENITIILTTHNMKEADDLCHRIAFINAGEIINIGTPKELKAELNELDIYIAIIELRENCDLEKVLDKEHFTIDTINGNLKELTIETNSKIGLNTLKRKLEACGKVIELVKKDTSLEDIYINLMSKKKGEG